MKKIVILTLIFLSSCSSAGFGEKHLNKRDLIKDPRNPYIFSLRGDVIRDIERYNKQTNNVKEELEKPIPIKPKDSAIVFSPINKSVILPIRSKKSDNLSNAWFAGKSKRDEQQFNSDYYDENNLDKPKSSGNFAVLWLLCVTPICILIFSLLRKNNKI